MGYCPVKHEADIWTQCELSGYDERRGEEAAKDRGYQGTTFLIVDGLL